MDGREIRYVTRHVGDSSDIEILGKDGRIICLNGVITVFCGTKDVFRCPVDKADYYFLPSLNTIMLKGNNEVTGNYDRITVELSRFHNM